MVHELIPLLELALVPKFFLWSQVEDWILYFIKFNLAVSTESHICSSVAKSGFRCGLIREGYLF